MAKIISKLQAKEKKIRKTPNDYPKFSFRIDSESKDELLDWVDRIYYLYQDCKKSDAATVRKNDIIWEALQIGLKQVESKILKRSPIKKNLSLKEWQKRNKRNKPKDSLF